MIGTRSPGTAVTVITVVEDVASVRHSLHRLTGSVAGGRFGSEFPPLIYDPWLPPLTFTIVALGTAAFVWTLVQHLDTLPEYPDAMVRFMRGVGTAIAIAAFALGVVMLGYAVRAAL